ncbi:MAG: hypothetical protein ACKVS9_16205 [Phycisphaerae bacterium]
MKTHAARRRQSLRGRAAASARRKSRQTHITRSPARIAATALVLGLLGTIAGGYAFAAASQYFAR